SYYYFFIPLPPPTEIYTLSLHDALPIYGHPRGHPRRHRDQDAPSVGTVHRARPSPASRRADAPTAAAADRPVALHAPAIQTLAGDRKSTRLNSSHLVISYAVFCLKKKNQ